MFTTEYLLQISNYSYIIIYYDAGEFFIPFKFLKYPKLKC